MQDFGFNANVETLRALLEDKTKDQPNPEAMRLALALKEGRFTFAMEPWHDVPSAIEGVAPTLPAEVLLRPFDDVSGFSPFHGVQALNRLGLGSVLDQCIVSAAMPLVVASERSIAVNTAAASWESPAFVSWIENAIPDEAASRLVLEITEDAVGQDALISRMLALKGRGVRFALDDFTSNTFDCERAVVFAPVTDFIKVSGETIEEGLRQPRRLSYITALARSIAPDCVLIAEWVKNPLQAIVLNKKYGFSGMQGRELPNDEGAFATLVQINLQRRAHANTDAPAPAAAPRLVMK